MTAAHWAQTHTPEGTVHRLAGSQLPAPPDGLFAVRPNAVRYRLRLRTHASTAPPPSNSMIVDGSGTTSK